MAAPSDLELRRREQHKRRMEWMPWLYFQAKDKERAWAGAWQREVRQALADVERVRLDEGCFVAPSAEIFAEPGREVVVAAGAAIAAEAFVHGPVTLGENASLNARVVVDGGAAGVRIGAHTRIASGATLYAWNHGTAPDALVREQKNSSRGIVVGSDVWIGANAGITDGVTISDGAIVGMGAVVTRDVPAGAVVAGVPARIIRWRDGREDEQSDEAQ
jgi:acetyltransferase-like isoleucine patch superfamily enzyme